MVSAGFFKISSMVLARNSSILPHCIDVIGVTPGKRCQCHLNHCLSVLDVTLLWRPRHLPPELLFNVSTRSGKPSAVSSFILRFFDLFVSFFFFLVSISLFCNLKQANF